MVPVTPPIAAPEPAQWLSRYGDELFRFARRRVSSITAAEELVQETFVSALSSLRSFRQEAYERTWLFVILRRKLVDYYRKQASSPLVPLPGPANDASSNDPYFETGARVFWRPGQEPQEWASADAELEQQELGQLLLGCQEQLPPRHQAVFTMRFVDDISSEEICQELNLSPSNYWVIIHRAKLQLRKCLEKHWFSGT